MTTFFADSTAADLGIADFIARAVRQAARRAAAAVRAADDRRRARYEYRHLLDCEDRFLADIALTRGGIRAAIAEIDSQRVL